MMNVPESLETSDRDQILLVDDSATVQTVFSAYLSPTYECTGAGSFDEAMAKLRRQDFAVVVTDIIMPGLSGIELLRKIVDEFPATAVIIVSGVNRPQRALDAMRLGAFDYLIKPCDPEVLKVTVERALKHRALVLSSQTSKLALEAKNEELIRGKETLERLQSQLVQKEKMASLGQLAAGVAHEINNPVGFVIANLEMLGNYVDGLTRLVRFYDEPESVLPAGVSVSSIKDDIGYPNILEDLQGIMADCREGSERIREIVQNLRTFSRLDEADHKETDIHEGIDATVRLLSPYYSTGSISLVRNYGDIPRMATFAGQLNQVWMNLLVNAAQAIGTSSGVVTVDTRADDQDIYVTITDSGAGIAVQDLKKVFDPFYTTKPVGEGTGLGLSISFGIVERHGGTISVRSRLNEGTAFEVKLPRHFEPIAEERSILPYGQN
ncbi:MAG: ATP-binding protein [Pyrinomonadaceae bacterium]